MKKLLAFILAMMLCFSLLVSCNLPGEEQGSEESSTEQKEPEESEEIRESIPNLNMATLISLVEINGVGLSWDDLAPYYYAEIDSGLYVREYQIDAEYYLLIGGESVSTAPMYIYLISKSDPDRSIDVRYESIEDFLNGDSGETEETKAPIVLEVKSENMMAGVVPNTVTVIDDIKDHNTTVTDFAVRLFKATNESDKNTLISPISVIYALAMVTNGAEGETKAQIEETLGMSVEELNLYLYAYMQNLPEGEKYKLNIANSIWFTDHERFTVNQSFLQKNADYYGADIYKTAFDGQTLDDINNWVNYHTDGLIPRALDEIPESAVMYLINALLFDAEWASVYNEYSVYDGKFVLESGDEVDMTLMRSDEYKYLEDENATGFIKNYSGGKYAFAALLPKEGMTVAEYIATLDGEKLCDILENYESTTVYATMPKFESEYDTEMSEVLSGMGIVDAFSGIKADFSSLGRSDAGNIYISRVIHKTYIQVGEQGTKAGAVTIIEATDECAPMEPKVVTLNRPFVYMIIDCENNIPIFIGTMMGY